MPAPPAYRIETPRLVLRCWSPEDAPKVFPVVEASVEHLRPWIPWVPQRPRDIDEQVVVLRRFRASFDLGNDLLYGVFDRSTQACVGGIGFHRRVGPDALEIGYWLARDRTGAGLATEMAAAIVKVGFEVERVKRLEIHCAPENGRSARVAERLCFVHEATLAARMLLEDGLYDEMIWSLWRDGYEQSPSRSIGVQAWDALGRPFFDG